MGGSGLSANVDLASCCPKGQPSRQWTYVWLRLHGDLTLTSAPRRRARQRVLLCWPPLPNNTWARDLNKSTRNAPPPSLVW